MRAQRSASIRGISGLREHEGWRNADRRDSLKWQRTPRSILGQVTRIPLFSSLLPLAICCDMPLPLGGLSASPLSAPPNPRFLREWQMDRVTGRLAAPAKAAAPPPCRSSGDLLISS